MPNTFINITICSFFVKYTLQWLLKKIKKINIKNTLLWWSKKYKFVLLKSPNYGCQKNHEFEKYLFFYQIHPIMVIKKNMFCFFKNTLLWWFKNYIYFFLKSHYYECKKKSLISTFIGFWWNIQTIMIVLKKTFLFSFFW